MNTKLRLTFLVVLSLFCFILSSCGGRSIYAMERDAEIEAEQERVREAISDAQDDIQNLLYDDLWRLEHDLEDHYGLRPEEACETIERYYAGEDIEFSDLIRSLEVLSEYYFESRDIIADIDDYYID